MKYANVKFKGVELHYKTAYPLKRSEAAERSNGQFLTNFLKTCSDDADRSFYNPID
jgi:hypothetical protein